MGRHVKAATKEDGMTKCKHPKHWKAQHGEHTMKGCLRFLMLNILQVTYISSKKQQINLNNDNWKSKCSCYLQVLKILVSVSFINVSILPIHVMNKELIHMGMRLLKYFPIGLGDRLMVSCSKWLYEDTSQFCTQRPEEGQIILKSKTGRSPILDPGTFKKIKSGDIKDEDGFFSEDGMPRAKYPNRWRGPTGLYYGGFSRRGLLECPKMLRI
ncbi:probable indole-3-pyruvate monooxygenase YUCCA10 [Amborella trichopoda]|uniref:probable indole-3-pyruvate monooxygenase YUCCA10 n=1 Tax=Amborella trichopoda TaxID=13333 RepID=UPI0005D2E7A2|nr:probable indole-3-pyruvate monooxygenase YUCCA10 [Amborella trichopoda]|eukprot:XP_011620378.1 probable indole-3-pyruvate monooxygenase YUCCA10 [Amborella trichopoda]